MKSLKTFTRNLKSERGFTLMELLVVIGLVTLVAAFGLIIGIDSYSRSELRNERNMVVSLLERARNRAMNNYYQTPHGVHIDGTARTYVLFRGTTYNPLNSTNEAMPIHAGINATGLTDVTFAQLSGDPSAVGTLTITDTNSNRSFDVSINSAGQINW